MWDCVVLQIFGTINYDLGNEKHIATIHLHSRKHNLTLSSKWHEDVLWAPALAHLASKMNEITQQISIFS